ncbi:ribonuclease P/MRP protein subunit POP5 [Bufo gargarizans]|uniref:ribonuclease P/MRP protein subunit POP5 n=1 Tax=Bufo bufo TaxID=8384 RepID=UPI001ABE1F62|nr:ribonuclease P/MRP protein subunit POP5 [Bufo bufo]XP_044145403.1 ribonuclease P/MRP protein subunit POP5 [Bufo gargarizans]
MRFKSRYFLCELVLEDPRLKQNISQGTVFYNVREAVARLHGDFGAAAFSIGLSVKYLNAYTGIILLRCRKESHQLLWSSLPFITSLENRGQRYACFINTLHIGGTIRTCQKFLIQYNRKQLRLLLKNCKNPEEKDAIQKSIASCSLKNVEEPEFMANEEID